MGAATTQIAAAKPSSPVERVQECPLSSAAGTVPQGALVGRNSAGYFVNATDTVALTEVGVNTSPSVVVNAALGHAFYKIAVERNVIVPFKIATLSTDAGARAVYGRGVSALYNNEVQLGAGSYSNWVGKIVGHNSVTEVLVEVKQRDMPASTARCAANVANSDTLTNWTTAAAFSKKATLNGALLAAGDVIKVRASVYVLKSNSTDTLNIKLLVGTEEICATGAVNIADGDVGYIDAEVVVRIAGASGHLSACGTTALGVVGTVTAKPFDKADAAEDLSSSVDVTVTATCSVANTDNQVYLTNLIVTVVPAL